MLTKTDLREIKKIVDTSIEEKVDPRFQDLEDKIDSLAIATKRQFDEVDKRFDQVEAKLVNVESDTKELKTDMKEMKGDIKRINRIQLSHETRLVNLEA